MKQVVRAFVYNPDTKKYLIVKHKNNIIWTLPGGHLEKWEDAITALKREILEEFGIKIQVKWKKSNLDFENIKSLPLPISQYKIEFLSKKFGLTKKIEHIYLAHIKTETLQNFQPDENEISEFSWMSSKKIFSLNKDEIYAQIPTLLKKIEKEWK